MTQQSKQERLRALAIKRQRTRWTGYGCIGDYHDGRYECDFVSPYTKTFGNVDAKVLLVLQDWASDKWARGPFDRDAAELGYTPGRRTNKYLRELLLATMSLHPQDVYATNLFPFIKQGPINASIRRADFLKAAIEFTLPQVEIIQPKLVVCLGNETYSAIRQSVRLTPTNDLDDAINSPFKSGGVQFWCQSHPGQQGRNNRGGVAQVYEDWRLMASSITNPPG